MPNTLNSKINISASATVDELKPQVSEGSKGRTVYVGMSGGVDSSVTAALLKDQGYDVTGVFIKVWQPDSTDCGWKDERRDAMRVCAVLDIPFLTFDFSDQYKKEVVDYMIEEYRQGRTPNPDVMCNRHVKFGSFLKEALSRGIDYVATGHYAQNIFDSKTKTWQLAEGADKNKDQSYFLWTLTSDDLKHVLFPVGHLQKPEVRQLAEKYKLPVFDKKDSQGVCFIGHLDMKSFLREYIETKPGNVLASDGTIIGEHEGALLYTNGERHGFKVFTETTTREPHFVISKDIKNNTITVVPESEYKRGGQDSNGNAPTHEVTNLILRNNLISNENSEKKTAGFVSDLKCEVRIRYRQERQTCTLSKIDMNKGTATILFDESQLGIASGQSAVFYIDEICMGGGIIV